MFRNFITPNRKRSFIALLILLSVFAGSVIIDNPDFPYGICLFRTFTGFPCPSCGMTHSFVSIGHLKILDGFYFNILGPLLYLALLTGIVLLIAEIILDRLIIQIVFERYQKFVLLIVIPLILLSWAVNLLRHFRVF